MQNDFEQGLLKDQFPGVHMKNCLPVQNIFLTAKHKKNILILGKVINKNLVRIPYFLLSIEV